MSAADVALIVDGAKDLALIACGTVLAWKALGRMRLVAPPKETTPAEAANARGESDGKNQGGSNG